MLHFAHLEPTQLYLCFQDTMPAADHENFMEGLRRHLEDNLPVQYIMGYVYFLGHRIAVDQDVLIPRYETEELVEQVLLRYDDYFATRPTRLVDIGTGSGCIAVAIKKEAPEIEVWATDISPRALAIARKNAESLGAEITFLEGDLLMPLAGKTFDIIVANPPYIPQTETVAPIIYDNEPHLALFGGDDGLDCYRRIIENAGAHLNDRFLIAFEHAYDAAPRLHEWAREHFPGAEVTTIRDMQERERMTFILKT